MTGPANDATIAVRRALALLLEVEQILRSQGGLNWLPGIHTAIAIGQEAEDGVAEPKVALDEMRSIHRSMCSGPGGYSDFFVWREDFDERRLANEKYNRLRDEPWTRLG